MKAWRHGHRELHLVFPRRRFDHRQGLSNPKVAPKWPLSNSVVSEGLLESCHVMSCPAPLIRRQAEGSVDQSRVQKSRER